MSVAPDFLLQSAPEVRPKAAPVKPAANEPEPSKSRDSSFAEVYAKERQVKAAERREASAKASQEKTEDARPGDAAVADTAAEEPAVADSGNSLPDDESGGPDEAIDPLLLMGLGGQQVADDSSSPLEAEPAVASDALAESLATAPAASAAPAILTEASHDPELDLLNSLAGVKLALEVGEQAQRAAEKLSPGAVAAERSNTPGFANALAALSGEAKPSDEPQTEGLEVELLGEGLESLPEVRESKSEARAEVFASKLNALSQAIGQQNLAAQRLPLVPGQPLQVAHAGMSEGVVDRVMWLSSQNLKSAEIQLDPAELGRLEVRIELNKDQAAQVTFVSPNAHVRDQLEGQAHRLREMLAQQGMNQVDVNVSDQSMAHNSRGEAEEGRRQSGGRGLAEAGSDEVSVGASEIRSPSATAPRGLVDYYA
ncbi:flagellar hook-length control protein FliK [Pseudomonas sp. zbq_18]|uniref:flagellar hook-length control protein FliK n=1 Tax=Pseudomonas sp. zbq_18 TaxID=3367251 RepID=UPI00370CD2B7